MAGCSGGAAPRADRGDDLRRWLYGRDQRGAEFLVFYRGQGFSDLCHRFRVQRAGGRGAFPARQRRLPQRQPADRAPAEEAVDPLQDDVGGMLDLQRRRALHPQYQRGRFLRLPLHRPRPLHLQRLGMGGDFGAGDVSPARHQFARGKTLLGVGVGKHVAEQDGERFCRDRAGFCHGCLISAAAVRVTPRAAESPSDRGRSHGAAAPDRSPSAGPGRILRKDRNSARAEGRYRR